MTYENLETPEYGEQDYDVPEGVDVTAAPPPFVRPWSWDASTLLWIAGGVLATSFAVWFLMSYTKERALAIARAVADDGTE